MPKQIPYPKFDLESCLKLCKLVQKHKSIPIEKAALILKLQIGGHFMNLVSSCTKFGLLYHKKGILSCSPLGLDCSDPEKQDSALIEAACHPTGFNFLYTQWCSEKTLTKELLASHLKISLASAEKAVAIIQKSFEYSHKVSKTSNKSATKTPASLKITTPSQALGKLSYESPNLTFSIDIKNTQDLIICEQLIQHISQIIKNDSNYTK